MKKISIVSLVLFAVIAAGCSQKEEKSDQQKITIVSYLGDVKVSSKDVTTAAKTGLAIHEGDVIQTGAASSADISINENGVARVS